MSTDLHDKIRSEVERRLAIARAATSGPWDYHTVHPFMDGRVQARIGPQGKPKVLADVMHAVDMWHVAEHDPADAIRRYAHALKILDDHHPVARDGSSAWASSAGRAWCWTCTGLEAAGKFLIAAEAPCPPITDLAESLGIDTGGQP